MNNSGSSTSNLLFRAEIHDIGVDIRLIHGALKKKCKCRALPLRLTPQNGDGTVSFVFPLKSSAGNSDIWPEFGVL